MSDVVTAVPRAVTGERIPPHVPPQWREQALCRGKQLSAGG
ncbi:hypothetical protein [Kineosporia mesophila]|nr:hypothetical protein [Kineosporia mesophila]